MATFQRYKGPFPADGGRRVTIVTHKLSGSVSTRAFSAIQALNKMSRASVKPRQVITDDAVSPRPAVCDYRGTFQVWETYKNFVPLLYILGDHR